MSISEPSKILTPWASTGTKNPIPQTANNTTGAAGFDKGFPDITMTIEEAGGLPPAGQDFNGIFYEITKILQYMQAGGAPTFDQSMSSEIGGYPKGAVVIGDDMATIYQSVIDSNTNNPNLILSGWKIVSPRIIRLDTDFSDVKYGDNSVDYGPAINTAIMSAASSGFMVDGGFRKFYTRTPIKFPSNLMIRRCNFESLGAPTGDTSPKSHIPVVHVDGVTAPVSGIYVEDVIANGRRDLWPNIGMSTVGPEGGGGEDGGMHAFRLAGRVANSTFVRCSGLNSGTAGWAIHNPLPATVTDYQKRNLVFIDCDGIGNREHGMFADSFDGINWVRGKLTGNGLDLNTTDPLQHGNRGAHVGGKLFGGPFDLECYPGFIGSSFRNFKMEGTDCRGNAVGALIYCPIPSSTSGLQVTDNITLSGVFDYGVTPALNRLDPNTFGYAIYTVADGSLAAPTISNLVLSGKISGSVKAHSTKYVNTDGLVINTSLTNKIDYVLCSGMRGGGLSNVVRVGVTAGPTVSFARTSGSVGAGITASLLRVEAGASGLRYIYSLSISGAVSSGGPLGILATPTDSFLIVNPSICGVRADDGQPLPCFIESNALNSCTIKISTREDSLISAMLSFEVVNQ